MTLLKCKECGNEISTKAESCPKCGAKTGPIKAGSTNMGCGALILGPLSLPASSHQITAQQLRRLHLQHHRRTWEMM